MADAQAPLRRPRADLGPEELADLIRPWVTKLQFLDYPESCSAKRCPLKLTRNAGLWKSLLGRAACVSIKTLTDSYRLISEEPSRIVWFRNFEDRSDWVAAMARRTQCALRHLRSASGSTPVPAWFLRMLAVVAPAPGPGSPGAGPPSPAAAGPVAVAESQASSGSLGCTSQTAEQGLLAGCKESEMEGFYFGFSWPDTLTPRNQVMRPWRSRQSDATNKKEWAFSVLLTPGWPDGVPYGIWVDPDNPLVESKYPLHECTNKDSTQQPEQQMPAQKNMAGCFTKTKIRSISKEKNKLIFRGRQKTADPK